MSYAVNHQHRNSQMAHEKSQWIIGVAEERASYDLSSQNQWGSSQSVLWGLHLVNTSPKPLGHPPGDSSLQLHIAKFVGSGGNWHGYPVATWIAPWDKPDVKTLKSWVEKNLIKKAKMAKIVRGKKCVL
jgi:hypothetical protein